MGIKEIKEKVACRIEVIRTFPNDLRLYCLQSLESSVTDLWEVFGFFDLEDMREIRKIVEREIKIETGMEESA